MNSIWLKTTEKPQLSSLSGNTETDLLIVGGGLTGLLCAYMLEEAGVDYLLIESDEICRGITQNTTAKITAQHGLIYDKIIEKYGVEAARQYYLANSQAVEDYKKLCRKFDCPFEKQDAFVFSQNHKTKLLNEIAAYRKIGIPARLETEISLPFSIAGAVRLQNQGQIHPLKLLYRLSEKLNIKEHTKLINLAPNEATTNRGKISFKKAIIATHFPIINKHGAYFLKMYQHRSYLIALEGAPQVEGMFVDEDMKGLSFRNYGKHLLLGGGGHRTGKKGGGWAELEKFARRHYPKAAIPHRWAAQDCITLDGLPYVGAYSKNTSNLFVATGFNKWGFTSSLVAAKLLRDLVTEKQNPLAPLLSPSRSILHPQLLVNGAEAILNLITPTTPRCPHLGCALKYNKQEHSWDCPCHGSRFTEEGKLICGPATDDKKL